MDKKDPLVDPLPLEKWVITAFVVGCSLLVANHYWWSDEEPSSADPPASIREEAEPAPEPPGLD